MRRLGGRSYSPSQRPRPGAHLWVSLCCLWGALAFVSPLRAQGAAEEGPPKQKDDAPSSPTTALSLEQVLQSVQRVHPLLRVGQLDVAVAEGELLSAEGAFDFTWKTKGTARPVGYYDGTTVDSVVEKQTSLWGVSTFAGWRLGVDDFPIYDGKYRTLEYGEVRAGVNVPFWRNGPIDRRRASEARAELATRIANLSYAQQLIELRRAASYRYWAWVSAGRKLDIAETLASNVEMRQTAVSARVTSGDLPSIEEADNARALEQRRAQVAAAQRSLEQAAIELSLFLRDSSGSPLLPTRQQLPSSWPESHREASFGAADVSTALTQRPEPKRLALVREQHSVELDYTNNQLAPAIDLQVAGSRDFGRPLAERPDLREPVLEVSLMLDIPLQNRVNQGRARSLTAQLERTAQQERFATDRVVADVQDALSAIRRAKERIAILGREVALALQLENAERARFEAGDSQLLIVNLREQQTAEAELREVDALFDYYRALADWRAARGE